MLRQKRHRPPRTGGGRPRPQPELHWVRLEMSVVELRGGADERTRRGHLILVCSTGVTVPAHEAISLHSGRGDLRQLWLRLDSDRRRGSRRTCRRGRRPRPGHRRWKRGCSWRPRGRSRRSGGRDDRHRGNPFLRSQLELPELYDRRLLRHRMLWTGRVVRPFGCHAPLPLLE
jgi:hypothetical protein